MSDHIAPGIHDMPSEQYFASGAVSNSDLKYIVPPYTPAHFRAYKNGEIEKKQTEALTIGSLTHACILEPEKVNSAFVVAPAGTDYRTKAGKEWRDAQTKEIISQSHADMISRMANAVWKNSTAKAIISNSDRERSLFAEDDGLMLRSRLDCLPKSGSILADLKTCDLADLDSVEKSIFNYGYYRQAAFYRRVARLLGIDRPNFVFIFVEKTPPHCVALYSLTDSALQAGDAEIDAALTQIRDCTDNDYWPGRDADINEASIPDWALKQMGNQF